ncbi:MAG: FAD-dependent monooxygenase [Blastocatellia bacterium]
MDLRRRPHWGLDNPGKLRCGKILGEHLRNWDMAVQWNTELIALEQKSEHAIATLKQPDGSTRQITAAYIAGCDGGRSAVRELNGIRFPGAPYEHVFFVADTEATGPMVADELNVYLWRDGFHLFFPMRGKDRWRVIGILPSNLRGRDDLTFEEVVPAIRGEAGAALAFGQCRWFSTYRIHHRCTERFRDRRCFLLGDAAHVHSPMGGQGMPFPLIPSMRRNWRARRSPGPRSTSCAPTAMSAFAGFAWKLPQSQVTSPSVWACGVRSA